MTTRSAVLPGQELFDYRQGAEKLTHPGFSA